MKPELIKNKPKRLFAFGCSFTNYTWTTWPTIVALDLDIPVYNFGSSGGGNRFMVNMLMLAHQKFHIGPDDLVMICWTNVTRECRYIGDRWNLRGNIYNQDFYSDEFVEKYTDPVGFAMESFNYIGLAEHTLKNLGCEYHFCSMLNIAKSFSQSGDKIFTHNNQKVYEWLYDLHKPTLDNILPSFYEVLWEDDINHNYHYTWNRETFKDKFYDGHPYPNHHMEYVQKIFNHEFKPETLEAVDKNHQGVVEVITEICDKYPEHTKGDNEGNMKISQNVWSDICTDTRITDLKYQFYHQNNEMIHGGQMDNFIKY